MAIIRLVLRFIRCIIRRDTHLVSRSEWMFRLAEDHDLDHPLVD